MSRVRKLVNEHVAGRKNAPPIAARSDKFDKSMAAPASLKTLPEDIWDSWLLAVSHNSKALESTSREQVCPAESCVSAVSKVLKLIVRSLVSAAFTTANNYKTKLPDQVKGKCARLGVFCIHKAG